ncbi:dissimilatory sulfite reductase D family protein [Pseudodesulfovibrio tunisiensis]|uniref:dissimilatory sulfite reductase D family protein n=1 Tax=Pseudodesulfovibrio tunisiensis TaxID=463192 RepID=UPI001FB4504C|nr:dissimilatory sulfite reductase D family protein [Pseudodesulfovibrio tunisiensis]
METAKQTILDFCESKSKSKSKFYFNDFTKLFPDAKAREVKKVLTALVNEEKMVFWSSGSTTMYGVAGAGKQANAEGEA